MILKRFFSVTKTIINYDLPICINCKYYIPYISIDVNDRSEFSTCLRFGKKNVVDGSIKYDYAYICRMSKNKCGLNGKYYEPTMPI